MDPLTRIHLANREKIRLAIARDDKARRTKELDLGFPKPKRTFKKILAKILHSIFP